MPKPKVEKAKIVSIYFEVSVGKCISRQNHYISFIKYFLIFAAEILGRRSHSENAVDNKKMPSLLGSFVKESASGDNNSSIDTTTECKTFKSDNGGENISRSKKQHDDEDEDEQRPSFNISRSKTDHNDEDDGQQRASFSMNSESRLNEGNDTRIPINQNKKLFSSKSQHQIKRIPNTGFILYEQLTKQCGSTSLLQQSAAKQGLSINYDIQAKQNSYECMVQINGKVYAKFETTELNKKEAKTKAFDDALEYARKIHYTIKVNIDNCHYIIKLC